MLRMKGSAWVMQQGQAQGLWLSGWFVLCQSSLLCTLMWRTRASSSSVLGWFPSSAGESSEPWNIQPLGVQRALCHIGTTSSIWMLKLSGDSTTALSLCPFPDTCPLRHGREGFMDGISCAFPKSFHSWVRRVRCHFGGLEPFTEGSCSHQQLNCRSFKSLSS